MVICFLTFQDDPNFGCHSLVSSSARVKLEVRAFHVFVLVIIILLSSSYIKDGILYPLKNFSLDFQEVFLQYLWNPDTDAILTALSCLKFLCTEIDVIAHHSMDNIAQMNLMTSIFAVYEELANLANGLSTGTVDTVLLHAHVNVLYYLSIRYQVGFYLLEINERSPFASQLKL